MIEQITYLLFIKRLDDLHTLEENKAQPPEADGARASSPRGKTIGKTAAAPTTICAGRGSRTSSPARCSTVVDEHVFPFLRTLGERRLDLRRAHEGRALRDPDAGAAREGRRQARRHPDGRSRHQGRCLRIHARQDRQRRAERPVPHAAPHHRADGRADGAEAEGRDLRPGRRHLRLPGRGRRISARQPPGDLPRRRSCASTSTTACSTASTSTAPCCASAP